MRGLAARGRALRTVLRLDRHHLDDKLELSDRVSGFVAACRRWTPSQFREAWI